MNDLETIQQQNGTTPEEAREAAKPYYYRPKAKPVVGVSDILQETIKDDDSK